VIILPAQSLAIETVTLSIPGSQFAAIMDVNLNPPRRVSAYASCVRGN
jgi:hypothetical protein